MLLFFVDAIYVLFDNLTHIASFPDVVPIFSIVVLSGVDDLKHVFRGIFLVVTFSGAVLLKVIEQLARVCADLSEVDSPASAC